MKWISVAGLAVVLLLGATQWLGWQDVAWAALALAALFFIRPGAERRARNGALQVVLVLAVGVGIYLHAGPKPSETKRAIQAIAANLEEADRVGNVALAAAQLEGVTAMLRRMNDSGSIGPCALAAMNLAKGIASVSQAGRWTERDRFDEALKDCR